MFGLKKKEHQVIEMPAPRIWRTLPTEQQKNELLRPGAYTPDMLQLSRYRFQLVFLCDEFQKGFPKYKWIENQTVHLCKADTFFPYVVWKDGFTPVPMKADKEPRDYWQIPKKGDAAIIRGGLYLMRPSMFQIIDTDRKNTVNFVRERVPIKVHYREKSYNLREGWHYSEPKMQIIEAWMWVGALEAWDWDQRPVNELKAVRMFKPNDDANPPYYIYTQAELYDD